MELYAPTDFVSCDVEWTVADGALVTRGATLAWLAPAGHCALFELQAPCPGVVARRTSLLSRASPGQLLAVVAGDDAVLRAEERTLVARHRLEVERELSELEARSVDHPAAAALLLGEVFRLRAWLERAGAMPWP